MSIFSILSRFKAPHIINLLKFFLNSIHGFEFSLERETIIEGDKWRGRDEVVSYAALFSVVVLREDRHKKWAAWQTREEKEIHND